MEKEKILRVLGNIFVIYAMIIFALTAYFDGKAFVEDISILNYIIRMLLGFVPALVFAVPGILLLESVEDRIKNPNTLEKKLQWVDLREKGIFGKCVYASICVHLGMIALAIILKIFSVFFSIIGWFF